MLRTLITLSCIVLAAKQFAGAEVIQADIVVYTATAGGVMASVAAARQGASVILLEPGRHVGGMLSGGLGTSDIHGQERLIGGLTHEVYRRLAAHYDQPTAQAGYNFEPHVAEDTLKSMLEEAGVRLVFGERLKSVNKENRRITSLETESGSTYSAKVYIDGGYEGDLMARAGVGYTVGREGRRKYDEWLAGRSEILPGQHQFAFRVSALKHGRLLPLVTPQNQLASTGEGDGKLQAYCFRLCLTDQSENQIPFQKPADYDATDYELLRRYFLAGGDEIPRAIHIKPIPNGKCDVNSAGPVSTNLLSASWEYPEATYSRREELRCAHLRWTQGLLWFLMHDASVPSRQRDELRRWGLCKDEFTDTGGWPHQLYIREARRMLGEYVVTLHDLEENRTKPDSIGMCGYNIDIREVQWVAVRTFHFPRANDEAYTEGYISQPVKPWQVPYRALVPKSDECENLLVPVCASMSTLAYGSFRMEPGYMIIGHASGVAAALAAHENLTVQTVPYPSLRKLLEEQQQILELSGYDAMGN